MDDLFGVGMIGIYLLLCYVLICILVNWGGGK